MINGHHAVTHPEAAGCVLPPDDVLQDHHFPDGVCRTPQSEELQPDIREGHQAQQTSVELEAICAPQTFPATR